MDARIGFVTQQGMDRREAIERGGDLGFDYVELMMDGPSERSRLDDASGEVRTALDDAGLDLAVHLPFGGIDIGSPFDHLREGSIREIEAALDVAADLGAEKAVLHASTNAWRAAWDPADLRPILAESIRRLDAAGREEGVEICVENIARGAISTRDFPDLLEATDARMTLDTGHARVDGYDSEGTARFAADHADRISHLHLNDTRRPRDEHLPFGSGTIDFARIFDGLGDWRGTLSLEVFTLDFDYVATSKERLDALL
jgi:sugar phosphate isomerase/epimerase